MSKTIKIILISLIIVLIVAGVALYYIFVYNSLDAKLDRLINQKPEVAQYIEEIKTFSKKLGEDRERVETYLTLGLAWKSLADRTQDSEHYRQALKIYQQGIEITRRRNTVLLNNAGDMAEYLGDFKLAEDYYKEAIEVAPGDPIGYAKLVDLYRWKLKKPSEEIIAVFDQGIARMFNPAPLKAAKEQYLEEIGSR